MQTIYTIGHGNRPITEFIQLLKQYEIQYLVDVRSAPYSRYHTAYSKGELHATLQDAKIGYLFLGQQLGGRPEADDCYLEDGRVDYDVLAQKDFYQEGIARLQKASEGDYRIAMMCSEKKPHECHRSKLIGRTLSDLQIPVQHIDEEGSLKTQAEVIADYLKSIKADEPVQLDLWGEVKKEDKPLFTSRASIRDTSEDES